MPGQSSDESQFIMAMGGIVTNMAAAPAGRQFLVGDPNGRELLQQIVRVLPVIPTPSGNCLKRYKPMRLKHYVVVLNRTCQYFLLLFELQRQYPMAFFSHSLQVAGYHLFHSLHS